MASVTIVQGSEAWDRLLECLTHPACTRVTIRETDNGLSLRANDELPTCTLRGACWGEGL